MRGIIEPSILTCLHKLFYTPHEEEITNLHSTVVTTEEMQRHLLPQWLDNLHSTVVTTEGVVPRDSQRVI